jgi:DNA-binding CsgD family transcriptional regulator
MPSMPTEAEALLGAGREALRAADWEAARSCFEQARELGETAEVLDGLSQAVHFLGDYDQAIELKERAFAGYRRGGKRAEAAEQGRWLAFLYGTVHGNIAAASGWLARAERLLEGTEESATHGWITLTRAPLTGDTSERINLASSALAIARRFGDADLEFDALALLGQAKVVAGRVAEGMSLIDEAMAAVSGGEVAGVGAVGDIYCRLLSACEHAADVRRAEQWIAAAKRFTWSEFVAPTCRSHYGGLLIAIGRWAEAEEELLAAIRIFERGYRAEVAGPLVRLADLRVRQGRFEEAERLVEGTEWDPSARRSLATIALARGDLAAAEELTQLCFEGTNPADPACAPLLELLVGIQVACEDHAGATETVERLHRLAGTSGDDRAAACAELAAGRACAGAGDEKAVPHLKAALERFAVLELPLEAARAQLELARVLAAGSPDAATAEGGRALRSFERLGAARDANAAARLLRELGGAGGRSWPRGHGELTKRETEVLSLLAEGSSNALIAERLFISRRTAEHHVASILSKLDLKNRGEAAAYAVRERSKRPVAE